MRVNRRSGMLASFIAMDVLREAKRLEAAGRDILHLEVGQPAFGAPEAVRHAAAEALAADPLGYTVALGLPELRARIARHYRDWYGITVPAERVILTTGASGGFTLAFLACLDPGARVALAAPGYPAYRNILTALDLRPVELPATAASRFQPTPDLLDAAGPIDALIIASPANPTGSVLPAEAIAALEAWCRSRAVLLIADEIYHGLVYDGVTAPTTLSVADDAIIVNSFSKYFAMTGWRLGWMVVPEALVAPIEKLAQNLFIAPPTVSQIAALAAFDCTEALEGYRAVYARNRVLLMEALPRAGFDIVAPPDGAFYLYADCSRRANDSAALCRRLLDEAGVALTPGLDFDRARGHATLRVSFAGTEADIAEAARRLIGWSG